MMNHDAEPQPSRREMFRGTLRYLALGGISLTSAGLIGRGAAPSADGGCRWSPTCATCPLPTANCRLPQAVAARRRHKS